jgi:hypothetical protein
MKFQKNHAFSDHSVRRCRYRKRVIAGLTHNLGTCAGKEETAMETGMPRQASMTPEQSFLRC